MALTQKEIETYRGELQLEHTRLMREIEEASKPQSFGHDVDDKMDEEADEGEAIANGLALAQALKDRVNEIEDALHRIAGGTYGICIQCGGEISKETLDAAPESELCSECKQEA